MIIKCNLEVYNKSKIVTQNKKWINELTNRIINNIVLNISEKNECIRKIRKSKFNTFL
jgi:hypothetical protein